MTIYEGARRQQVSLESNSKPRPANGHDGTILTEAPDVMWGTDPHPTRPKLGD